MDSVDRRILAVIQKDSSISHSEIAERVHLSASQCSRRLQRLHERGIIRGTVALLDEASLGLDIEAYVTVSLSAYGPNVAAAFHERMLSHDSILECCALTGDSDYLLRIVTKSLSELSALIQEHLLGKDDVGSVRSSIVLDRIKRTTALPV
jgi:Lrp/AsnC family leucine-responsive transcriptional regulator